MIVFLAPGGRLGNLLFQVAFIESIRRPRERVFTMNLFGVHGLFKGLRRYYNTDFRPVTRLIDKAVRPWLGRFLERTRLVSTCREEDSNITVRRGLFPITFLEGYFQRPLAKSAVLAIGEPARTNAARVVTASSSGRRPVFVHVRRGDYHTYRVNGVVDPLLGEGYYRAGIELLQRNAQSSCHFFFLGDSPEWCRETFRDVEPKTISSLSPLEDLAIMSLCEGGVVSNSTFAWWGAYFCPKTLPVVGPRFWLAWRHGYWLPRKIETEWMTYIDVPQEPHP